jgi:hypothetical protein
LDKCRFARTQITRETNNFPGFNFSCQHFAEFLGLLGVFRNKSFYVSHQDCGLKEIIDNKKAKVFSNLLLYISIFFAYNF